MRLTDEQRQLAENHLYIALSLARHRSSRSCRLTESELASAAALGVCIAAANYDESKGACFATYAKACANGAILDEMKNSYLIHVPAFLSRPRYKSHENQSFAHAAHVPMPVANDKIRRRK